MVQTTKAKAETPETAPKRVYRPHKPIGTDNDGHAHHLDAQARRVHVIADGTRTHVQELGTRPVADWIAFVDEKIGWESRELILAKDVFGGR